MDFGTLIHTAQKNEQGGKKEIKYYSTKFEPPKKQQRSKSLSVNIQKFLARKEDEEKKKMNEAKKRRDQLLELRSKDKKAVKRVNVMLKRTKSANQSVIQDAVDEDNTAVTLAGPSQPDEDDYGYVSQSAADYYNKMMEKYSKMPDEPKFQLTKKKVSTNLTSTKDRVKAALDKEQEEAMLPHRRKRKHKEGDSSSKSDDKDKDVVEKGDPYYEKKEEKPARPKLKAAPVINFSDLLKIAEKKQFEPIVIEQKEKEEERLMTKKQRREMEKEREIRESKERREQQRNNPQLGKIPKLNGDKSKTNGEKDNNRPSKTNPDTIKMPPPKMNGLSDRIPSKNQKPLDDRPKIKPKLEQKSASGSFSSSNSNNKLQKPIPSQSSRPEQKRPEPDRQSNVDKSRPFKDNKMQGRPKDFPPKDLKPKQFPPNDLKPKQFPPNDVRPKQFPPKDLKSKQFSPRDMYRGGPPMKRKPLINKGRFYDDDDEEYDSEMDDFIDDGPDDENDYSKHISEIFGYDKRKYRYVDDDVDDMESSFAQQMKEEVISTKLGIKEDLEDMKLEEEQKRKKALLMKKRR